MNSLINSLKDNHLYQLIINRGIQIVKNDIHKRELNLIGVEDASYQDAIEKDLEYIYQIFHECEGWALSGGLSIYLTIGKIQRKHNAHHIGVQSERLLNLLSKANRSNYFIFSRIWNAHISETKKLDYYLPLNYEQIENICSSLENNESELGRMKKNWRLIKIEDRRGIIQAHKERIDYFDIYIHDVRDSLLFSNDDCVRNCPEYYCGANYQTKGGIINLVNISYLEDLKRDLCKKRKDERHIFDLERIIEYKEKLSKQFKNLENS